MYQKINFKDHIDTKPDEYYIDGRKSTIKKTTDGVTKVGTDLNAENLNHLENGIYQNSIDIVNVNNTVTNNKEKFDTFKQNTETQLENTKGIIAAERDTGVVSTPYKNLVASSYESRCDSSMSALIGTQESSIENSDKGFICSSTKCYLKKTTTSRHNSILSSAECEVSNGMKNIVVASQNVSTNLSNSICGGYSFEDGPSSKNKKWEIDSKEGTIKAAGAITGNSTFADFAEYFESADGKAIPTGTIVTLENDKIRPCNEGEEMLGVISETAGVLLNASGFCWQDRYMRNEFGGLVYEEVLDKETEQYITVPKENPNHDIEEDYIPREDRAEWNVVGLTGQVYIRCDDTVGTGDFIKSGDKGIATKNNNPSWQRWKVMKVTTPYNEEKGYGVALVFIR